MTNLFKCITGHCKFVVLKEPLRNLALQNMAKPKTVGIIVIGDEILKGQVRDTNSAYMTKKLFALGLCVEKISVIGDTVSEISEEVRRFSEKYTYVITSGGIGPTHDDVTFEGIAKAFDEPLIAHPDLVRICSEFYKTDDLSSPGMKLAHIPKSAVLTYGYDPTRKFKTKFPNVSVRNVYIFPGIPQLLEKMFNILSEELFKSETKFYTSSIYLTMTEVNVARFLNEAVKKYGEVTFGSYPEIEHNYYNVKVTIQSCDEKQADAAHKELIENIPKEFIIAYDPDPLENADSKLKFFVNQSDSVVYKKTLTSLYSVFDKCSIVYVWFDGQIESTVLLHLCYTLLKDFPNTNVEYVYSGDETYYKEQTDFIEKTKQRYKINITNYNTLDCIKEKVATDILIYSKNKNGNPINDIACDTADPLKDWQYQDLWNFTRALWLPYCVLYDHGYTHLGNRNTLKQNQALKIVSDEGSVAYLPAYKL